MADDIDSGLAAQITDVADEYSGRTPASMNTYSVAQADDEMEELAGGIAHIELGESEKIAGSGEFQSWCQRMGSRISR